MFVSHASHDADIRDLGKLGPLARLYGAQFAAFSTWRIRPGHPPQKFGYKSPVFMGPNFLQKKAVVHN